MNELLQHEVINGRKGVAIAKVEGNNEDLFFAKGIEAKLEKKKGDVNTIGSIMTGSKTTSAKGTGSMTLYYLTPLFRKYAESWVRTGKDLYFDLLIENDDPESGAGKQSLLLTGVNLDSVILAKLDSDSEGGLEEEVSFTYSGFRYLSHFKER